MKKMKDYIIKNNTVIEKALYIDNNKWNENKKLEDIIKQIELELALKNNNTYLIIYEGEPILTKNILEKAIDKYANVIFTGNDYYLATNTILIEIANKLVKENEMNLFFKLYNNIKEEKIFENTAQVDATIYIGPEEEFEYIKAHVQGELIKIKYEE